MVAVLACRRCPLLSVGSGTNDKMQWHSPLVWHRGAVQLPRMDPLPNCTEQIDPHLLLSPPPIRGVAALFPKKGCATLEPLD